MKDGAEGVSKTLSQLIKIKVNNYSYLEMVGRIVVLMAHIAAQNTADPDLFDSIKYLFDHQSRIYKYHFLTEENAILLQIDPATYSPEERAWREALEAGSELDAVKIDPNQKFQKVWSRCQVKSKKGDRILVTFYRDLSLFDREISIYSKEIGQLGQHSEEEITWRAGLKAGDNVDCWDSTGFWYASTIMQIQEREFQGARLEMAYIGYRVMHPDGDKTDDQGNRFFGWEDKYDDWVPLYSACLARYRTYTDGTFRDQTSAAQNSQNTNKGKVETKGLDDTLDMSVTHEKGELIYAVQRSDCRSELLVNFLNTFGRAGGFSKMMERVEQKNPDQTELLLLAGYTDCLAKSAPMFHRQFVDNFMQKFII